VDLLPFEGLSMQNLPFCLGTQFTIQAIFSAASFLSPIFALDASVS